MTWKDQLSASSSECKTTLKKSHESFLKTEEFYFFWRRVTQLNVTICVNAIEYPFMVVFLASDPNRGSILNVRSSVIQNFTTHDLDFREVAEKQARSVEMNDIIL